ncbi:hypothetical protein Bca4012_043334 [Brassica carinata]
MADNLNPYPFPSNVHVLRLTVESNPQFEFWFCSDQLVRSWIFGILSEEVLSTSHTLSTSCEVWFSLAESYNKSSLAREFSLPLQEIL